MPTSTNSNAAGNTENVSAGRAVGHTAGQGGAVTQITNRSTGVTLNAVCGQITTDDTSLAAEVTADFTVTNDKVASTDVVSVCIQSGSVGANTKVLVRSVANGSFVLDVANDNAAGGVAETGALVINFIIHKSVAA